MLNLEELKKVLDTEDFVKVRRTLDRDQLVQMALFYVLANQLTELTKEVKELKEVLVKVTEKETPKAPVGRPKNPKETL